jgi:hypothetical protein
VFDVNCKEEYSVQVSKRKEDTNVVTYRIIR